MEEWKDVKGFEGLYLISNCGRVKSLYTNETMSLCDNGNGYLRVSLHKGGKQFTKYIHVLVAQSFIINSDNMIEVNHKDENKLNNHVSNLEWCDHVYNCNYGTRNERALKTKLKPIEQYDSNGILVKVWTNLTEICNELGYKRSAIRNCIYGLSRSSHGYIWKYK